MEREKLEFREGGEEGWIGGYNFCMVKSSNGVEVKIASKSFKEARLFYSGPCYPKASTQILLSSARQKSLTRADT